jgi:hypothetical protein
VFRARDAASETPPTTPVLITQNLTVLRLERASLIEEYGTARAVHEAGLADAQAREVDGRATAVARLQVTRTTEKRVARAERTAGLAGQEVAFLLRTVSNVRRNFLVWCLSPSGKLIYLLRIGKLRKRGSCAGPRLHSRGQRAADRGSGERVQGAHTCA